MNEKIAMGVSKNYENIQFKCCNTLYPPNIIPREYNDSNGANRKQASRKKRLVKGRNEVIVDVTNLKCSSPIFITILSDASTALVINNIRAITHSTSK